MRRRVFLRKLRPLQRTCRTLTQVNPSIILKRYVLEVALPRDCTVAIAQLVEHRIVVPSVVGSIPISHPILPTRRSRQGAAAPLAPDRGFTPFGTSFKFQSSSFRLYVATMSGKIFGVSSDYFLRQPLKVLVYDSFGDFRKAL